MRFGRICGLFGSVWFRYGLCLGITTYYLGTGISLWNLFFYRFFLAVPGDILLCDEGRCLQTHFADTVSLERITEERREYLRLLEKQERRNDNE